MMTLTTHELQAISECIDDAENGYIALNKSEAADGVEPVGAGNRQRRISRARNALHKLLTA